VRRFHAQQSPENQPLILCDCSREHTYVHVSTKGARLANEDSFFADGLFFGVFDGHCGNAASALCRQHMAANFYKELKERESDLSASASSSATLAPSCVQAMHAAFAGTQEAMPEAPNNSAGSTAVACWIQHAPTTQGQAQGSHAHLNDLTGLTVYAGSCGDSQVLAVLV
jgi:serine/threonine protein phosphatase PrpC